MALTRRGQILTVLIVAVVIIGAVVGLVAFGSTKKTPSANGTPGGGPSGSPTLPPPPPICPLTGVRVATSVPNRPALAVKLENLPSARPQPHNLYSSTQALYAAALTHQAAPQPMFTYAVRLAAGARKISVLHVPFSSYSDVFWKWSGSKKAWLRFHGDVPHLLSDGTQVS